MHIQRKESELLATRSLVRGQWALLAKSPEAAKAAFESYQTYADAMFPFLERAANTTTDDNARLLEAVSDRCRSTSNRFAMSGPKKPRPKAFASSS